MSPDSHGLSMRYQYEVLGPALSTVRIVPFPSRQVKPPLCAHSCRADSRVKHIVPATPVRTPRAVFPRKTKHLWRPTTHFFPPKGTSTEFALDPDKQKKNASGLYIVSHVLAEMAFPEMGFRGGCHSKPPLTNKSLNACGRPGVISALSPGFPNGFVFRFDDVCK